MEAAKFGHDVFALLQLFPFFSLLLTVLLCSLLFCDMKTENSNEIPHPDLVLRAAQEEPPQRLLDDYTDAIHELREKNFTFREIAEWLGKFGFEVDHNAVWRAYAKTVPEPQAHQEAEADEKLEREESYRDAELNGRVTTVEKTETVPAKKRKKG
jgi:hypothetical protein